MITFDSVIWPSQLSSLGSSVGRATCTYNADRMSHVQVLPEVAHFSLKMTALGELQCALLPCESLGLVGEQE